jgi:hypothetical protein
MGAVAPVLEESSQSIDLDCEIDLVCCAVKCKVKTHLLRASLHSQTAL